MAVENVEEETRGRNTTLTSATGGDLTREFVVKVGNRTDNEYTIYADGRIPYHGSPHPSNYLASLRNIRFRCERAYVWRVTCEYSTRPEGQQQNSQNQIVVPWFRPAVITGGTQAFQVQPTEDAFGKSYVNSANTPFSESPTLDADRPTFIIRKNVPNLPSWFYSLQNKRNSNIVVLRNEIGVILTAAAKFLKYKPIGFSEVKREGSNDVFRYIEVSYELTFDADMWEIDVRDRGRWFKPQQAVNRVNRVVPFDEGGEQNLDGFGGPLPDGAKPKDIHFRPIGDADFSVLPTS